MATHWISARASGVTGAAAGDSPLVFGCSLFAVRHAPLAALVVCTFLAGVLPVAPSARAGETWTLTAKLLATEGAARDEFGTSVSIDGDTAVVGAPRHDLRATDAGAAFVFRQIDGQWRQIARLALPDPSNGDRLGWSVSLSGDTVLAGVPWDDDDGTDAGSAAFFRETGGVWRAAGKALPLDAAPGNWFGWSVSIDGDTAVIGALRDSERGPGAGAAYVFREINGAWREIAKLTAEDGQAGAALGWAVALHGDTALVSAYLDDERGTDCGAAYVFREIDGVWTQIAKLTPADGKPGQLFGRSVALFGDTAVIGSPSDEDHGVAAGAAYFFREIDGEWTQIAKVYSDDIEGNDHFGYSAALSESTALIGAEGDDDHGDDSGSIYVFHEVGGVWTQTYKLTAPDGQPGDEFGWSCSLSGYTALIGAYFDDENGQDTGSAYVFRSTCPGDVDGDRDVDLADLAALLAAYDSRKGEERYNPDADFDADGDVDTGDLATLLANYRQTCP